MWSLDRMNLDVRLVFVLQLASASLRKRKAVWQFRKVHARHGPKRRRRFFAEPLQAGIISSSFPCHFVHT